MPSLNMSTVSLWMVSLWIAGLFLKEPESADANLFPSPPAESVAATKFTGKNHLLDNRRSKRQQQPQMLQHRWTESASEDSIQSAKKPLELDLERVESNARSIEWRNDILKGITVLPKQGNPGRLLVFGQNAEPILTGSTDEDVFIAAAEFGKGRIVVVYQECSLYNNFSQYNETSETPTSMLNRNIVRWLTRGTFNNEGLLVDANDEVSRGDLMASKIVIYYGKQFKIPLTDLTDFLRNGGALLHCLAPWKWWMLYRVIKGSIISDEPYMTLLNEAGIVHTDDDISAPETGFLVSENRANDAHLIRIHTEAAKNHNQLTEKRKKLTILNILIKCELLQLKPIEKSVFEMCSKELDKIAIPNSQQPAASKIEQGLLNLWLSNFYFLEPVNIKAPGVNLFPGDFTIEPPLRSQTLEFHSDISDFYSTGYYLPAGQTLGVEVISGNYDSRWQLIIGCHTDVLRGNGKWRRWPNIHRRIVLSRTHHQISSPFGGLIYLFSPAKPNLSIKVKFNNVVASPQFRRTEDGTGRETWENSRRSPGLWADIAGEFIRITMPSSSVRHLEFDTLAAVMKTWDSVVRLCHDLRGTNVSAYQREWIVTDEQPSVGHMHSGHPIVTHMDVAQPTYQHFLLNRSVLLTRGNWGAYHEIGHNTQRSEWTFSGGTEVTANIFTLYVMEKVNNIQPWNQSIYRNMKELLNQRGDFKSVSLLMYVQLAHEFGWESFKKVFRLYEAMNPTERPTENQDKIDKWFVTFSEIVKYNLAPFAHFWNIELSSQSLARLQTAFPVGFLPDDDVTRSAPERVNATLRQFPKTVRKTR